MNVADIEMMERAIAEAEKCSPLADRIPKVGAVIALDRVVIGKGHRGTGAVEDDDHAEMNALQVVADRAQLPEATIYTTLEPCTPEVRSNPHKCCTALICQAEVKKVFIGILDPNQGVRGKGLWELQSRGIDVELFPPDLAKRIRVLNEKFIRTQQTLGMHITNLQTGQIIDTTKTSGAFTLAGRCLNPPGDDVYVFTNTGGQWWPQPHNFEMTSEKEWRIKIHFGEYGPHTIYILKTSQLGVTLVNYYKKTCNAQLERIRILRGKLQLDAQSEEDFLFKSLPGPYQGIEMGSLPKGLELQDKVDIVVKRTAFESLDEIVAAVPSNLVPVGGQWNPASIVAVNNELHRSVVGTMARLEVVVGAIDITPEGRYRGIARILAKYSDSPKLATKNLVYGYFGDANDSTKAKFESLKVGDKAVLYGEISRADLDGERPVCLTIDLQNCWLT